MPDILNTFFLLALVLPALCIDNREISPLNFGQPLSLEMVDKEIKFFTFTIPKLEADKDLLIFARPIGYASDPDLFLSTKNQHPSSQAESEYASSAFGFSSINLPNEELEENVPYYLGVKCSSKTCNLTVSLEYQADIYMEADRDQLTLYYLKQKTQIIRTYIPEDDKIEHILFATEVQGQLDEKIYMYLNKGNDTPDSKNSGIHTYVGWKDGEAAGVYRGDPNFCTRCNYTIAIEAPRDAVILFSRKVYGPTRDLQINSAGSNDALHRNSNITYEIDLTTLTEGGKTLPHYLTVTVTPYLGSLETFINFNQVPENLSNSEYDYRHHNSERIDIDLTNRNSLDALYVTVVGKTFSNFHIKVETSDQDSIILLPGEFEFGIARPGIVSNFLASVYGSGQFDMSIDVHANQGSVALFVKRCQDKDKCRFETDEVAKLLDGTAQTSTKDPILLYSNITHMHESIDFTMDGSLCGTVNDPLCLYAIGVTPINEATPVNFTVAAIVKGDPRALKVNTPVRESIGMNDYSYYYFTVGNDEDIEEVNFQITEITGVVSVYISREERYPDSRNHEKPVRYNDLYTFDKERFPHLNGTYYIAVTSMNSATYSILPKIRYTNSNTENNTNTTSNDVHILQLEQVVPQKITLESNELTFFKFSVRQKEGELEGIEIFLTDVRGQLSLCVRDDGQIPQKFFCQWSTTTNSLQISPTDPNFKADATYILAVHSTANSESDIANSFVITWSKFSSFKILSAGPSITSKVSKDSPQFYKIEVYPQEDKELVIGEQTTSVADFVDLFVYGFKPDKNTNFREAANKTKVITSSQLILDESTISQLCTPASSRNTPNFCVLYIVITTNSTNEVKFSLGLQKEPENIKISENIETMAFFPSKYSPVHLYYYPSQRKDITVTGYSMVRPIRIYVNVIDTDDYTSLGKWSFPTKAKNDYESLSPVHNSVDVHIPAYALSACGAYGKSFTCAVAITVDYEEPKGLDPSNLFFIMASQEVIPIAPGRPITSTVAANGFKYFSLEVSKTQATLLISVACISKCSTHVVIAKGEDKRPTPFGGYDYQRGIFTSEAIQISDADAPGNSMKGTWIIGIFTSTNSSFVLEVAFEEQKILNLVSGTPIEAAVPTGETISFLHFHVLNDVLNFRVTREKGAGKYWVTKYNSSLTMEQNIASQNNHLWSGSLSYSQDIIKIDPSDPNFCSFCKYVISFDAEKEMRFSIVAYAKNAATWLRPESVIRDYVDSTNKVKYTYVGTHDFLDLNVLVYSGEVELYVQLGYNINETDYTWKRTANSGTKYIRLPLRSSPDVEKPTTSGKLETFQVLVASSTPTNYSIGISFSNSTSFLYDGRQVFGFLNPGESNNYLFFEVDQATTSPLKVQFVMYRDQFAVFLNETERFPEFKLLQLTDDAVNKTDPIEVSPYRNDIMRTKDGDVFYRQMLQYAQLKQGHYKFLVTNNYDNGHFNYSLALNSDKPLELPLNNIYASRTAVGKKDVYVVHTSEPGTVVVELHKCVGDVDILVSNSLAFEEPLSSQLGGLEQSTLGSHIVFMSYSLEKPGTVYIKVTSIDGVVDDDLFPEKEAVYKIKADFYDTEKTNLLLPYNWFSAGKDGNLHWTLQGHDIQLEFDDVNSLQANKVSTKYGQMNFTHTYDLFMTKDIMPAQYLARCDMVPKQEGVFKNVNTKYYSTSFQDSEVVSSSDNVNHKTIKTPMEIEPNPAFVTLRVTLSGTNSQGDHIWSYPIIYETTLVSGKITEDAPTENIKGLTVIIIIIAVLILSASYGAYYFYKRYKRIKSILNYEIQDMSSIGTIEGDDGYQEKGIELGKMKYSGLPEQSD